MPSTEMLSSHARHLHSHNHGLGHAHTHELRHEHASAPAVVREATEDISRTLAARDSGSDDGSDNVINIMLVILGITFFFLLMSSAFLMYRRSRRQQRALLEQTEKGDVLPTYQDSSKINVSSKGHGLTIETKHHGNSSVYYIGRDGHPMLANPNSPPHSPDNVPEIRITFPDEKDEQGRPCSGRVVVVRVGDNSALGLEPLYDEQLPAYEKDTKGFQSIDMDQIGGLKEKDPALFQ